MICFGNLSKLPREAWIIIALRPLATFGYFALRSVLILYLSKEHGYDDLSAAAVFSWAGFVSVIWGIFTGPLIDRLGVRRSMVIGSSIATLGLMILAFSFERYTMVGSLFVILPIGFSMVTAAFFIGADRYSYAETRSIIFSLLYFTMNAAASVNGSLYELFRMRWPDDGKERAINGMGNERVLLFISMFLYIPVAVISGVFLRDVRVGSEGTVHVGEEIANPVDDLGQAIDNVSLSPLSRRLFYDRYIKWYIDNVFCKLLFWRLVAFTVSLVFIGQVYGQLDATMPKFAVRVLGPRAPLGLFNMVNPVVIMLLIWLSPFMLRFIDPYVQQILGSFVSATAIFVIALLPTPEGIVASLIVFSVGEAMYAPQTAAIVMSMSPEGNKATYSLLSGVPLLMSPLAIGYSSGFFLSDYCPAPVVCETCDPSMVPLDRLPALQSCANIWNVVAAIGLASPVLLVLFYRFIYTADVKARVAIHMNRYKTDSVEGEVET
jgi:MFS family permease